MTTPTFKQPRSFATNGGGTDSTSIKRGGVALLIVGIVITLVGATPFLGAIVRTILAATQYPEQLPFALGGLIAGTLIVGVGVLLIVLGSRKLAHNGRVKRLAAGAR